MTDFSEFVQLSILILMVVSLAAVHAKLLDRAWLLCCTHSGRPWTCLSMHAQNTTGDNNDLHASELVAVAVACEMCRRESCNLSQRAFVVCLRIRAMC